MIRTVLMVMTLMACGGRTPSPEPHDDHGEHDDQDERVVTLTDEAVASARLVVSTAESNTLGTEVALPARITLDPRKEAIVSARSPPEWDAWHAELRIAHCSRR